ncbi:multicopper oxidase family protein [Dactylosporangium sp. AC04546]|uniref:multicopper oxidase family protein n=1 Tax=Dactylosporangium sp. AC04546 TaxID=2862460 RepID=UPI001EDCB902|nr:multicopper oxidase family protein [Dactylosporangium sp. AC04546]WVK79472.1 multicopper oxidase family protein [Dactylosporangium sp. AC04546]
MTARLIDLELLAGVLSAAAWLAAAGYAATRRHRPAAVLVVVAVLAFLARIGLVAALGRAGWWFVQEKLTLTLPMAAVTAAAAAAVALTARRWTALALAVAAYGAAAGPVLALFAGYPAGWGIGLVTAGTVALAGVVTWQAAGHRSRRAPFVWLLALAPVVLGAAVAVPSSASATSSSSSSSPEVGPGVPVSSVRGPDPEAAAASGIAVRRFTLTARTATVTLSSGQRVQAWTFDGRVPGPALEVTQGDLVVVTLRNADIAAGVTLHWHGYDVPAGEDGVAGMTQEAVRPGGSFEYRFRADQAGTYWYHTHEASDRAVRLGLYGTLVVRPRAAAADGVDLTLPLHTFGTALTVGDRDQPTTHTVAPGTPVRLRVVNTDDGPHRLTLTAPFRLVAVDGTDLNEPGVLERVAIRLPAGARADLAVTAGAAPVTLDVDGGRATVRLTPAADTPAAPPVNTAAWPTLDQTRYGTPAPTPFDAHSRFDRRFTMVLDRGVTLADGLPKYAFTVNGRAYPYVTTQTVRAGDLVHLTVVNRSRDTHPMHLHGHHVLALRYNGRPFLGSPLWMDTFDVQPGEVWEVGLRADNPGVWMNHCHNLKHAAKGMAVHLAYEGYEAASHHAHGA